jgi:hypothetical protein
MESFRMYIKWFYRCLTKRPTADTPVILLLDNHASRFEPSTLRWAVNHHIKIWTFQPNSTAVAQPLDAVAGPFKTVKVLFHSYSKLTFNLSFPYRCENETKTSVIKCWDCNYV